MGSREGSWYQSWVADGTDARSIPQPIPQISRRSFLASAAALTAFLAGCGGDDTDGTTAPPASTGVGDPPTTTAPPTTAQFVARGPDTRRRVALTFHTDGALDLAEQLVAALERPRTPITAFVVGKWLEANPTWARRLTDAGHELANHTYTHPAFATLDPTAMLDEITRCRDVIVRLTGSPGRHFRTSGTANGLEVPSAAVLDAATRAGYPYVVGFDVDPLDYTQPSPATITQRVLTTAQPGSIVSLHFGYPATIAALPAILDGLRARDLSAVTLSDLLDAGAR
jgi:peptidoglycan/xylan/chitin deacetylase (PgdA/CDA1 family)